MAAELVERFMAPLFPDDDEERWREEDWIEKVAAKCRHNKTNGRFHILFGLNFQFSQRFQNWFAGIALTDVEVPISHYNRFFSWRDRLEATDNFRAL